MELKTDKAPKPVGPYNQGTRVGNMVYTSGQVGLTLEGKLAGDDVGAQAEQALKNVEAVLEAGSASFESTVKTTVFLTVSIKINLGHG